MRSFLLMGMSFALTTAVIGNAYYQKKQFYPSVVYITKSNPSMAVMYIQALVFVVLMGKLLRALFFGQLRAAEMEHLIERSWYAVTETCLAFTVFRDDFSPRFVALFTLLLFLKCFHWLAEDRIDYMERSPAISWLFHLRALSLMLVLGVLDILFVRHAFYSTLLKGPSVQLVFGFEYEILFTVVLMTFFKYILHSIDLQSENPWDNKAVYLLYSELLMGFIRVVLYILFVAVMIKVHTFPLFAIRPMYLTLRAFQKAAQDVILSRRAIRNMNTLYPDATEEELSSGDNVCIICREEMTSGCKKLPCNHIFHTSCLRSWFQRQQTCPTCRLEVLRMPRPQPQQQQQPAQPAQPLAQGQPGQPANPFNNMPGAFGGFPFQWPMDAAGQAAQQRFMWPPPGQQPQAPQQPLPTSGTTTTTAAHTGAASTPPNSGASTSAPSSSAANTYPSTTVPPIGAFPGMPPFMPPVIPPMMPPMFSPMGFPPPPMPMAGLTDEELRAMEGVERTNIEARIQWLRDIQALLDGAMVLIGQYNTVASHLGTAGIQLNSSPPSTEAATSAAGRSAPSASAAVTTTQQQQSWWPAGQGARPKYTSTVCKTETTDTKRDRTSSVTEQVDSKTEKEDSVEGASGYTPPISEQEIPSWEDPREEEHEDSMHEVRKRRLQHFAQQQPKSSSVNSSNGDPEGSSSKDSYH